MDTKKCFLISILGIGLMVGSLVGTLIFPILIMFAIGCGLLLNGVFHAIEITIKNSK